MVLKKQFSRRRENGLIFVSYFFGIEGMVMSEWAQDKLFAAESNFLRIILITSYAGKVEPQGTTRTVRIPSLSWKDYSWELREYSKNNVSKSRILTLWYPIASTIGRVWDLAFQKVSTNSAARWSWSFTALPVVLLLKFCYPGIKLFVTGGATGGHLLGLLTNLLTKLPLYLEFQDPLMGAEMARNNLNSRLISKLEGIFISKSARTVFVTESAAKSALERHPALKQKIVCIYPGARKFIRSENFPKRSTRNHIEFLHLGTLYGARNLDKFFVALDNLRERNYANANRVVVKNLGDIYLENKFEYLMRPDFEILPARSRSLALFRALDSDVLMLVQHADSRSKETIPFKTFDYLNLSRPIFGVVNNPELNTLLDARSHFLANANSVESIIDTLEKFLDEFDQIQSLANQTKTNFKIETQFAKIFE